MPLVWSDVTFRHADQHRLVPGDNRRRGLAMLAALYLNFQLPPLYRTRRWMLAAGFVSAAILVAVTAISGWELRRSLISS